jgi:hypothetical protein
MHPIITGISLLVLNLLAQPTGQQQRVAVRDVAPTSLPRAMAHQGTPLVAKRWTDRLGENTLVLTQTGKRRARACEFGEDVCSDAEVYAYHYVRKGATTSLLWRTTDFVRGCSFDLYAGYLPESVAITDLDGDGVAESSFMYLLACRSDVSPATLKLIMHEGAQKYAARGTSRPRGAPEGGEMRLDDAFSRASRSFASFAGEQWRRFRSHDRFQQF